MSSDLTVWWERGFKMFLFAASFFVAMPTMTD
jgi:hypothetical protein